MHQRAVVIFRAGGILEQVYLPDGLGLRLGRREATLYCSSDAARKTTDGQLRPQVLQNLLDSLVINIGELVKFLRGSL